MESKNLIITLSGDPVSGKSTAIKNLKALFESMDREIVQYSTGSIFRDLALEHNMSVLEFNIYAKTHPEIDKELNKKTIELEKKINSVYEPNKVFLIDSRMAWHFIPEAFSVRLSLNSFIGGRRCFKDTTRNKEDTYSCLEDAIQNTLQRKLEEQRRYMSLYNADLLDPYNYNLVIDTAAADSTQVANLIYNCANLYKENKEFPRLWKSPRCFLPTKDISKISKKDMIESSKKDSTPIYAVEDNDYYYTINGEYKIGASLIENQTLIPYTLIDRRTTDSKNISEEILKNIEKNKSEYLKLHSDEETVKAFEHRFHFRYLDTYQKYPYDKQSKKEKDIEGPEL